MPTQEISEQARKPWQRVQSWLGVGPLLAFACFHLWQLWPALEARELWVDRARSSALGSVLLALLAGGMVAHAVLGMRSVAAQRRAGLGASQSNDPLLRFRLVTGVLLLSFVAYHMVQLWPEAGAHSTVRAAYDTLWTTLGRPGPLIAYVVGATALAFHVGTSLARVAERLRPRSRPVALRYLAGLCGLLLWLGYLQVVARFAIGEGLIPTARPLASAIAQPSGSP